MQKIKELLHLTVSAKSNHSMSKSVKDMEAEGSFYHPHQKIAIDERMVASKSRICLKQYMKAKPTKWGYKLLSLQTP